MFKILYPLVSPRNLKFMLTGCLILALVGIIAGLAFSDDMHGSMDNVAKTFMDILTGPISKIIGGVLVIVGVTQLIQRNWSAGASLLLAAILLIKLKDLMNMFGGN